MISSLAMALSYGCKCPRVELSPSPVRNPTGSMTAEISMPKVPTLFTCHSCYDEAVKVRTGPPKHRNCKTIFKHHRSECLGDMEVYEDGTKSMIKCASCAPGGLPCDKCLPLHSTEK